MCVRRSRERKLSGCRMQAARPQQWPRRDPRESLRGLRGSPVIPREHFTVLLIIPVIRELSNIPGPSLRILISVEIRAGRVFLVSN